MLVGLMCSGLAAAAPVPTGGATPAAAVKGYLARVAVGDWSGACSWDVPKQGDTCRAALGSLSKEDAKVVGRTHVARTLIQGSQALVAATGTLCLIVKGQQTSCMSDNKPDEGMPSSKSQFEADYHLAAGGNGEGLGPIPLQLVAGRWYLIFVP